MTKPFCPVATGAYGTTGTTGPSGPNSYSDKYEQAKKYRITRDVEFVFKVRHNNVISINETGTYLNIDAKLDPITEGISYVNKWNPSLPVDLPLQVTEEVKRLFRSISMI